MCQEIRKQLPNWVQENPFLRPRERPQKLKKLGMQGTKKPLTI